jgi:hypothetical protein
MILRYENSNPLNIPTPKNPIAMALMERIESFSPRRIKARMAVKIGSVFP